jgi:Predicted nucleotide-binding protein containing TIR-like domain
MPDRVILAVTRDKAESTLASLIQKGEQVYASADAVRDEQSFDEWKREAKRWVAYTKTALQTICVDDALVEEFQGATGGVGFIRMGPVPLGQRLRELVDDHTRELDSLRSMVDRLELFDVAAAAASPEASEQLKAEWSTRVFVVHGRQRDSADVVARYLAKLGLEAVILDEQANEGRTILEKLEANTEDVGFAVVLLQADDHGRGPEEEHWSDDPNRARQNVILELGFFVGKIGRARVAALVEPTVDQRLTFWASPTLRSTSLGSCASPES